MDKALRVKRSVGSTHPDRVASLAREQRASFDHLSREWQHRRDTIEAALSGLHKEFAR